MRVLVVGAGAVGQVYGYHLSLGGGEVSFFVKEKYVSPLQAGLTLIPLNKKNVRLNPVLWSQYGVLSTPNEVAQQKWDLVVLTMSSTALRGDWLDQLRPSLGDATVLMLQPGAKDLEYLESKFSKEQIVEGVITVISYHSELGMHYYFPPLSKGPFSGSRAGLVIDALNRGGIASKLVTDVEKETGVSNTPFSILFCTVDAAGWSLEVLSHSKELLKLSHQAAEQASSAMAAKLYKDPKKYSRLPLLIFTPLGMQVLIAIAKAVLPFDVEKYLKQHFTKVGDQMRFGLKTYAEIADQYQLPSDALRALLDRITDRAESK